MHIRPRTRRRLLFLLALAGAGLALLVGAYLYSQHRTAKELAIVRHDAMAAYQDGDYAKAARMFREYRDKSSDSDGEVLFAFAKSRSMAAFDEEPAGAHLSESIRLFKQYLDAVKPDDPAAEHELLKLYVQTGYFPEASHLADGILARNPADSEALWQDVFAQVGEHREDQALVACKKLNDIEPLNISAQKETLHLMIQTRVAPEQVIAYAENLRKSHDGDPRFEVTLAEAYLLASQPDEARKWLESAAKHAPPDAQFVVAMAAALDDAEQYDASAAFLTRSADAISDASVQRLLAQRLWQNRQFTELARRFGTLDPASPNADGMLLGYRALALFASDKAPQARLLIDAMAHRHDPASAGWAIALPAKFDNHGLTATEQIAKFAAALTRDPQNPVVHLMLAETYLNVGESELAIQECNQAFANARSWAMPHVIAVEALLADGRTGDAVLTAEDAVKRSPGAYLTEVALAKAHFALAEESDLLADYARVVPELEQIQQAFHDPQTQWMYVTVLSRSGKKEAAAAAIKQILSTTPPVSAPVLTKLAEVADAEKLEIAPEVFDAAEKAAGMTAELAFAKARSLLDEGKDAEGLEFLVTTAKGHEKDLQWRMALAGYREMCRPSEALKDWIALGDQNPKNLHLQQNILRANSRANDRDFWSRTIDRVRALAGEQGLLWRVERSRWLLAGDASERDKAEAVNLLTQVTRVAPALGEPHRLLALAMEKVVNQAGAISELTAASNARPDDYATTRELVRLLNAANRTAEAQARIDALASMPRLSHDARSWLVQVYLEQGANHKALDLLTSETGPLADSVQHQRVLAELYRRLGRNEEAAKLYASLLDRAVKDPAFFTGAADFFASQHDMASANKFLAKLAQLSLQPGEAEIKRAQFAEQWVGIENAFQLYKSATVVAPHSEQAWENIVEFFIRRERYKDAASWADQGLKSVAEKGNLMALRSEATTITSLGGAQDCQLLIDAICRKPQDSGATQLLAAIAAGHSAKLSGSALTKSLREIADQYPQDLAVQGQVIESCITNGQLPKSLELARKLAEANPNSPLPQRLLAKIHFDMGEWSKSEQATLLWRDHSMDRPMAADVQLAEIYLRQPRRNAAGAVRALSAYISPETPAHNPLLFQLYLRALVRADRSSDAANLLKPLVSESPKWRAVWLDLAPIQKDASAAEQWINQLTDLLPANSPADPIGLATAWYEVGDQFDSPPATQKAAQIIKPLLNDAKDTQVWMIQAEISHALGDLADAEKYYRMTLVVDPHWAKAMNNLAYIIWLEGGNQNLDEAKKLAESSIAENPGDASFYDTLARIEARLGDTQNAAGHFRTALQKDPTSVEAMIGLASLLAQEPGRRAQARELISQIQRLLEVNPRLPVILQQQYKAAQEAVASSL